MIYEYNRGNPGWATKVSDFVTYINNGWHAAKVDFVMNKFCFIDQTADWATYRDSMTALEAANSGTKFVYWTMPLMTSSDSDQVLRAQFNENLRNWIATQDHKILFDIADIEAWSPAGVQQTFLYNGTAYAQMVAGYSSDGGHLNQTGYDHVATGLYSLFGQATLPTATPTGNPPASEVQAYPNPAQSEITFDIPTPDLGVIEIQIYNFRGERIGHISAEAAVGPRTLVAWNCANTAPGVYLAQIKVGGKNPKNLKFAIKH